MKRLDELLPNSIKRRPPVSLVDTLASIPDAKPTGQEHRAEELRAVPPAWCAITQAELDAALQSRDNLLHRALATQGRRAAADIIFWADVAAGRAIPAVRATICHARPVPGFVLLFDCIVKMEDSAGDESVHLWICLGWLSERGGRQALVGRLLPLGFVDQPLRYLCPGAEIRLLDLTRTAFGLAASKISIMAGRS